MDSERSEKMDTGVNWNQGFVKTIPFYIILPV